MNIRILSLLVIFVLPMPNGLAQNLFRSADSFSESEKPLSEQAMLGVHVREADATLRSHLKIQGAFGLVIEYVNDGSAAKKAGLKANDVLYRLDAQILANVRQLHTLIDSFHPGAKVEIGFYRMGEFKTMDVELAERTALQSDIVGAELVEHHKAILNVHSPEMMSLHDCRSCHKVSDGNQTELIRELIKSQPQKLRNGLEEAIEAAGGK